MKRPAMPVATKIAAVLRNVDLHKGSCKCRETGETITWRHVMLGQVHFDHAPPLALRARNEDGTFIPDANDINFIDVVSKAGHFIRTNKNRGLQRGDLTAIAHSRKVRRSNGLEPAKEKRQRVRAMSPKEWRNRPCEKHPDYKAKRKPISPCDRCVSIWNAKHPKDRVKIIYTNDFESPNEWAEVIDA